MRRVRFLGAAVLAAACLFAPVGQSQPNKKAAPKLEAVAETKLLMAGLADPNLKGLGQLLKAKPKDAEGWTFARGQALLVAETGNLLMLRPPKGRDAQDSWMALSAELRDNATTLARTTAAKDYVQSRAALATTANTCNRCHQTFRVGVRVNPFPDE
ncbi:MAG TPA: cytochrome c [Gemmataceae bacterium]|nr:cytochrome c [Gemmataceae bacterium]